MFELPSAQFTRVLSLFDPDQPNSTMLFSTLEGRTPGKVYVDDVDHPTASTLVINFYNTTFLGGALDPFWVRQALSELRRNQDILVTWSPRLAVSLEPPALEIDRYEFYDRIPGPPLPVPAGHYLRTIDEVLLPRCLWYDETLLAFGTTENYLANGIGLCLMANDEICSEAYAVFRGAGKFEIGVITHEKYRRRGYALLVCQNLVEACEARGTPTSWSCHQENTASAATARKLGYQVQREYKFLLYPRLG
jgi:RimJ/RimL family protein N-acetyltransferase